MLNGDWQQGHEIQHYCPPGRCEDRPTLQIFEEDVTEALTKGPCAIFPQHRWMKGDASCDWTGLLAHCHQIFATLVGPWLREVHDTSKPVRTADFVVVAADADNLGQRGLSPAPSSR